MEKEILGVVSEIFGTNSQIAEYQSNIKFFDEIENFLLGSFDKNGKYVIPEKIADELVNLKKIYQYAFGEMAFCESEYKFDKIGNIQFAVKMEQSGKNMVAKLCIVQEIKRANGILKKNAVTEIKEYCAINSPSFVNDCFEKFNIHSKKEDGLQKTEFQQVDAEITLARLKYLAQKNRQLDAQELAFKDLVEKKLALLAKYKLGKKIVEQYTAFVKKESLGKLIPGSKGYYRNLNSLLDKFVDEHKAELLTDTMLVTQWGKLNASASTKIRGEVLKDVLADDMSKAEKPEESIKPIKEETKPEEKKPEKEKGFGGFGRHHHGPGGPHHHRSDRPFYHHDGASIGSDVSTAEITDKNDEITAEETEILSDFPDEADMESAKEVDISIEDSLEIAVEDESTKKDEEEITFDK